MEPPPTVDHQEAIPKEMPAPLTLLQKVQVFASLSYILTKAAIERFIVQTFTRNPLLTNTQRSFAWVSLRHMTHWGFPPALIGTMMGTTRDSYKDWCASRNVPMNVVELPHGAKALWYGKQRPEKGEDKVLLYLHGGGFGIGGTEHHWAYIQSLVEEAAKKNVNLSCAFLEYDLTHRYPYPRQLIQSAAILSYLLNTEGWRPSQITLSGESAGGNLVLALLLHILKPCPNVPITITLPDNEPICAAISLSPWLGRFYPTGIIPADAKRGPNERLNDEIDIINPVMLADFCAAWLKDVGEGVDTRWAQLDVPPVEWWAGLHDVCPKILVTVGTEEALYDCIVEWVDRVKKVEPCVELMEEQGVHCEPALSCGADKKDVKLWLRLLQWFETNVL